MVTQAGLLTLPLAALWVPCAALAQVQPDAGAILQQVRPAPPPAPGAKGSMVIDKPFDPSLPESLPVAVTALQITGNTRFDTPTLHALVAQAEGQRLTLAQLGQVIAGITDFYRRAGYPLARAVIPAQTIEAGVVRVEVIEAHYGQVLLDNSSRIDSALLESTLAPLRPGEIVAQDTLDRALLLLSDIPGVEVAATIKAGAAAGSSDLWVNTRPGPGFASSATLDNHGNRYTGRLRASATASLLNPLGRGDELNASVLTSGRGTNFGRLSYETLVSGAGTRLGGAVSMLDYRLGGPLAAIGGHGTARVMSLSAQQPLWRSAEGSIFARWQAGRTQLRDHIDASGIRNDRHIDGGTLMLSGNRSDGWLAGGTTLFSLGWSAGRVGFDDAQAAAADAATARTEGSFSKWALALSRQQALSRRDVLAVSVFGQWTNANLDSSEKLSAGGPTAVRGYDTGVLPGDSGQLARMEWRRELGELGTGRWRSTVFVDGARMTINRQPWTAAANGATLRGAGVALAWASPQGWQARVTVAAPLGGVPPRAQTQRSTRVWAEAGWHY
ncbi:MAG: ShlB/FhaC/HecB family hemolysin secretion/activation protein [Burkholderiaceae bacterium]